MDVRAAMEAFQVIWNNPIIWFNFLVYPGDFSLHDDFSVNLNHLKGSGFDEIVFKLNYVHQAVMSG